MPKLNNPTDNDLFAHALGQTVPAGGSVDITDEQAAQFIAGQVFTVSDYKGDAADRNRAAEGAPTVESKDDEHGSTADGDPDKPAIDDSKGAKATRSTAQRGSKTAEVNTAPQKETR